MMNDSKKLRHEGPWGLGVGVEGGDLSLSLVSMLQDMIMGDNWCSKLSTGMLITGLIKWNCYCLPISKQYYTCFQSSRLVNLSQT